jgi:hypothetical protein
MTMLPLDLRNERYVMPLDQRIEEPTLSDRYR